MPNFLLSAIIFLLQSLHAVTGFDVADFQKCQSNGANFAVIAKNVGQGSSTVLKNNKNSHYYMGDAGTSSDAPLDIINRIAAELGLGEVHTDLPSYVNTIAASTSHSDKDHINIFSKLFNLNAVLFERTTQFILGDLRENYDTKYGKDLYENVAQVLDKSICFNVQKYIEDYSLSENGFLDAESLAQNIHLSILCSNAGHGTSYYLHENTNSAIIQFCINGQNILIMGDASAFATRRYMINPSHREALKNTQLLIESHHGASDAEGANDGLWLSQIKPKHVAISAGFYGRDDKGYYHPNVEPFVDLTMIGFARYFPIDTLDYLDRHQIAIGVSDSDDYEYVKHQLSQFFTYIANAEKPQWLIFQTDLPIYSTAPSGDLRYTFNTEGTLVDFSREY